jgi:general secretion pathway protein L
MSTLIVQLPAQPRLAAVHADTPAARPTPEYDWVLSTDAATSAGQAHGRCGVAQLPRAQSLVAVLPAEDAGWHLITAPKAPAARLRMALAGMLEEQLLEDEQDVHLATSPSLKAGEPAWVASVGKAWLKAQLDALEATGLTVDRVVPAWAPTGAPAAHVYREATVEGDAGLRLAWRDDAGAVVLPLHSDAARALLTQPGTDTPSTWTASPDAAEAASQVAGHAVAARSNADSLLAATQTDWNLRQFDLAPQHRGSRALRDNARRFWNDTAWRPVRLGLAVLLGVQLIGANVWAWQQRQAVTERKLAVTALLQTTFPQVRAVIDAPVQMQKELDLLRTLAGKPGDTDLEPLLYAAEAAWPPSRGPADALKYEPGRLTLNSTGWSPAEVEGLRERLRALGLSLDTEPGKFTLYKGKAQP